MLLLVLLLVSIFEIHVCLCVGGGEVLNVNVSYKSCPES